MRRLRSETRLRAQADDGIKFNPVISEDMRLGNDTSREMFADNFVKNRGKHFVQSNSKKWQSHFFDSFKASGYSRGFFIFLGK